MGNLRFKKIDLLSGIRQERTENLSDEAEDDDENEEQQPDSKADSLVETAQPGCKPGLTCIEDYSADSSALAYFFDALANLKKNKKPVRVAMFGDSFIEGDVFCGSIRDTLQTLFGGRGVGYVPVTSEVAGFRNTIKHAFDNWKTYSLLSKKDSTISFEIGPVGYSFIPNENNWVEYKPSKQRYLREFSIVKLYYKNPGKAAIQFTINDSTTRKVLLKRSSAIREWTHKGSKINRVMMTFENHEGLQLYGASFENPDGVYVDNFSMRGNSGPPLYKIPDNMFKEFNYYRDYKLIVLQYGLNVPDEVAGYKWYVSRMSRVVQKLKQAFPRTSILLIGVSDRSTNAEGELKTIKNIPALRDAQRAIAKKTGIAFWDLYEAMGGENSMVKFVEAKPALAAKDYTHLTFRGGKKLAHRLVSSMLNEMERYEKRMELD